MNRQISSSKNNKDNKDNNDDNGKNNLDPAKTAKEQEIQEWLDSLLYVIKNEDEKHVLDILRSLQMAAFGQGLRLPFTRTTPYINSIPVEKQPIFPGNHALERKIRGYIRWNALALVSCANQKSSELGGHISTFASSATLYETGFNHFFKAASKDYGGDLIYIQGHASPGIYARAFLEGRLSLSQMENFRQELAKGGGLPSYPHPRLLPSFWQFPTVSMGLSPIMAIYQAKFSKYLENRSLKPANGGKVWAFLGDGETDEPETLGAIDLAAREKLDNLVFVINCNLQRLDGPVRGNGKIIQELEGMFRGAGWNVIKIIWGNRWDHLINNDTTGLLQKRMLEVVDGDYQKYSASSGAYVRKHFFGKYPELLSLVKTMSDDELANLNRGGHDSIKVYSAFKSAADNTEAPTVILAKTIKGYGMGGGVQARNITHQQKSLPKKDLLKFRTNFSLPLSDKEAANISFVKPAKDSVEIKYLQQKRASLNGFLPARKEVFSSLKFSNEIYQEFAEGSNGREVSTTMSFVRLLTKMLRDEKQGKYVVPIVPDEARTFGMEGLFSQVGIYSSLGQTYEPVDKDSLLYYNEKVDGQLLEEGITEAGAMSSFIAAGTAYANYSIPMLPFFIYYSIFGFQRIGDLAWAAGDIMAKGFMIGATAGRTTLAGEGLQHQDGHSLVLASTIPCLKCYDPAFAYELAVIIKDGIKQMYQDKKHIYYYITVYNENYSMPEMPKGIEDQILKGIYKFKSSNKKGPKAHLWGSGAILNEALKAADILTTYGINSDVWSVTSYVELRKEALACERHNLFHPTKLKKPYITKIFANEKDIVVATSDYMKVLPDSLMKWVPLPNVSLGTDGFGRSETRMKLRDYFEIDAKHIAWAAASKLHNIGKLDANKLDKIKRELKITFNKISPVDI
ncbi:MAG: pyruvate dehydrogenase (acetyl-transferring), homodimeric type [SAR324 cluster bacterium]|nr:pyruvate dehydrogenase (acetyl-transferring), homodimeric type [SAR324 cluster bacterium]